MNAKRAAKAKNSTTKLFVLDTNVLMHDPLSLFRFEEHDIFVPMMTLEELDANKKGMSEVARNARQSSRLLDEIVSGAEHDIARGIDLGGPSRELATGHLFLQTEAINGILPTSLPTAKADNQIIGVVMHLGQKFPKRPVILVSKDINMRIKARALGLEAQDYFNDKVLEDTDLLYTGTMELPPDFWDKHGKGLESWKKDSRTYYRVKGPLCPELLVNEFVWQEGPQPLQALGKSRRWQDGGTGNPDRLQPCQERRVGHHRAQSRAELRPQPADESRDRLRHPARPGRHRQDPADPRRGADANAGNQAFSEIIITRVTVPVGEDIGFLPGTEEEKMTPWMGALEDNLDVLNKPAETPAGGPAAGAGSYGGDWGRAATMDLIRNRIKIKSLNFMRGRTFMNKFLIIDEAQNLTPKQMKTLITRAGPAPRWSAWATSPRSTRPTSPKAVRA
jgi:PhoH-like ATPase